MANLTNFIYCLNAEQKPPTEGQGGSINAMGVLSVMTPEFVPGTFSFSIIFSVLGVKVEENNSLRVVFKNKDQNKSLIDTGDVNFPQQMKNEKNDLDLPPECLGYNLNMDFRNIVFEENGYYTTEVYLNGNLIGSQSIYVKGKR